MCVGITIVLATSAAGFAQSTSPDAPRLGILQRMAMRELQGIAYSAANILNVYMDARVTDMLVCCSTMDALKDALVKPETREDACRILEAWLKASGNYDALLLLDKNGLCVAAAPETLVNRDFSDDKVFKEAAKGKLTFIDAHKSDVLTALDPKSNGWTAAVAVPMKTGKDLQGVLVSYLKWSRVAELVRRIPVGMTGYVYVLNAQNQVIIHPSAIFYGKSLRGSPIKLPALDDAVKRQVSNFRYEFENPITRRMDNKFAGFAYPREYGNFPGLGWTVCAAADETEMAEGHVFWWWLLR